VFCDSAGVRELVIAHRHATAAGADFRVAVPHHYLRDRLIRTGRSRSSVSARGSEVPATPG
jgi:anti-anti-sigma regulatory factor